MGSCIYIGGIADLGDGLGHYNILEGMPRLGGLPSD
jgi:hypothetical protein